MVKTLKNLLLLNQESFNAEFKYIALRTLGLPNLFKWWPYIGIWLFYSKVRSASLCICHCRENHENSVSQNVLKTSGWNLQCSMVANPFTYNQNFAPPPPPPPQPPHRGYLHLPLGNIHVFNLVIFKHLLLWISLTNFHQIFTFGLLSEGYD